MKTRKMRERMMMTWATVALMAQIVGAAEIQVQKDVAYLEPDRNEKMDVYLPASSPAGGAPAVLWIHGGGWRVGDKASSRERQSAEILCKAGYAVFSINYLLNVGERNPETGKLELSLVAWPQSLYDCKTALRFIRAEADRFHVDPDRIAVMGGSAGGHLAMMVGATAHNDEMNRHGLYLDQSNQVSCIGDFYGIYDVRNFKITPFTGSPTGATDTEKAEASPVTWFDQNLPPMLIVHGTDDTTVPVEHSRELVQVLTEMGLTYQYIEIPGASHSFSLLVEQMDLVPMVLDFLSQNMGE